MQKKFDKDSNPPYKKKLTTNKERRINWSIPSPSLSNKLKASLNSEICSSVSWFAIVIGIDCSFFFWMGLIFLKKEKERIEETAKKQRFESYSDQTCLSYIDATNFFTINKIDLFPFSPLTLQKLLPNLMGHYNLLPLRFIT